MSNFEISFESRPDYLYIKGKGTRKDIRSVFESTKEFSKIVQETSSTFILLDYSEVATVIRDTDVFNLTRLYETKSALLHQLCVSIIINAEELDQIKFWEEICQKRGFNFKIFISYTDALAWLLDQKLKH